MTAGCGLLFMIVNVHSKATDAERGRILGRFNILDYHIFLPGHCLRYQDCPLKIVMNGHLMSCGFIKLRRTLGKIVPINTRSRSVSKFFKLMLLYCSLLAITS